MIVRRENAMMETVADVERQRMAAVRRYDGLDTPPDGAFDRITALAARLFEGPIAIMSTVDTDRLWFKSRHGVDVEQTDREPGLCASAILYDEPCLVDPAAIGAALTKVARRSAARRPEALVLRAPREPRSPWPGRR
jgi:hypothetical protein